MKSPASVRTPVREHVPSVLVAALSAAFGVGLLQITGFMAAALAGDDVTGSSGTVAALLSIVAIVFIVIAVYVSAIITANTFATIVAGRARSIALLRLLGSSATSQRHAIASEGLFVGVVGTVIGAAVGTGVAFVLGRIAIATGIVPEVSYGYWDPVLILPVVGVILTTWMASWVGSRRVLSVTPLQALGGSEELSREEVGAASGTQRAGAGARRSRGSASSCSVCWSGLANPIGVLIGLVGGILSFTGIVFAADVIMPPALRLVGRAARALRTRAPRRRERAAPPAAQFARDDRSRHRGDAAHDVRGGDGDLAADPPRRAGRPRAARDVYQGVDQMVTAMVTIFSILIGFSGVIAAVGLVNNLSLSVLQRTRELGLLRALGFSVRQLRRMILSESAQLTLTAVVLGIAARRLLRLGRRAVDARQRSAGARDSCSRRCRG